MRPPFTEEMRAAGMEWRNGSNHWKLFHEGQLITVWPHGRGQDLKCRNAKMMLLAIKRRLRQTEGDRR